MKHLFVPYELAVKLKEKGFDEPVIASYKSEFKNDIYPTKYWSEDNRNSMWIEGIISAPLYQQVIDWFREKHNLHIEVRRNLDGWAYNIIEFSKGNKCIISKPNETEDYYQELKTAIEEALKLI